MTYQSPTRRSAAAAQQHSNLGANTAAAAAASHHAAAAGESSHAIATAASSSPARSTRLSTASALMQQQQQQPITPNVPSLPATPVSIASSSHHHSKKSKKSKRGEAGSGRGSGRGSRRDGGAAAAVAGAPPPHRNNRRHESAHQQQPPQSSVDQSGYSNIDMLFLNGPILAEEADLVEDDPTYLPDSEEDDSGSSDSGSRSGSDASASDATDDDDDKNDGANSMATSQDGGGRSAIEYENETDATGHEIDVGPALRTRAKHSLLDVNINDIVPEDKTIELPPVDWEPQDENASSQNESSQHNHESSASYDLFSPPDLPTIHPPATPHPLAAMSTSNYDATLPPSSSSPLLPSEEAAAYERFKSLLSSDNIDEFDADDDGEFQPDEEEMDQQEYDEEEYRNDRSVSISKKEIRYLKSDRERDIDPLFQSPTAATTTPVRSVMSTRRAMAMNAARSLNLSASPPAATVAAALSTSVNAAPSDSILGLPPRRPPRAPSAVFASSYSSIPTSAARHINPVTIPTAAPLSVSEESTMPDFFTSAPPAASSLPPQLPPNAVSHQSASNIFPDNFHLSGPAYAGPMIPILPSYTYQQMAFLHQQALLHHHHQQQRNTFSITPTPAIVTATVQSLPPSTPKLVEKPAETKQPIAFFTDRQRRVLSQQLKDHVQLLVQVRYLTLNTVLTPMPPPNAKGYRQGDDSGDDDEDDHTDGAKKRQKVSHGLLLTLSQLWDQTTTFLNQLITERDKSMRRHRERSTAATSASMHDPFNDTTPVATHSLEIRPLLSLLPMLDSWYELSKTEELRHTHSELVRQQDPYQPQQYRSKFPHLQFKYPATTYDPVERPWSPQSQWFYTPLFLQWTMTDIQLTGIRTELLPMIHSIPKHSYWTPAENLLLEKGLDRFGLTESDGTQIRKRPDWKKIQHRYLPAHTVTDIRRHTKQQKLLVKRNQKTYQVAHAFVESDDEEEKIDDYEPEYENEYDSQSQFLIDVQTEMNNTHQADHEMREESKSASLPPPSSSSVQPMELDEDDDKDEAPSLLNPKSRRLGREISEEDTIKLQYALRYYPESTPNRWKRIIETFLPEWDRLAIRRVYLRLLRDRPNLFAEEKVSNGKRATSTKKVKPQERKKRKYIRNVVPPPNLVQSYVAQLKSAANLTAATTYSPPSIASSASEHKAAPDQAFDTVDMSIEDEEEEKESGIQVTKDGEPSRVHQAADTTVPSILPIVSALPPVSIFATPSFSSSAATPVASTPVLTQSRLPSSTFTPYTKSSSSSTAPHIDTPVAVTSAMVPSVQADFEVMADETDSDEEVPSKAAAAQSDTLTAKTPVKPKSARVQDLNLAGAIVALRSPDVNEQAAPSTNALISRQHSKTPQKSALVHSTFQALAHSSELLETVPAPLLAPVSEQLNYTVEQYAYASSAPPPAATPLKSKSPMKKPTRTQSRQNTPLLIPPESLLIVRQNSTPRVNSLAVPQQASITRTSSTSSPTATQPPPPPPRERLAPRSARILAETTLKAQFSAKTNWSQLGPTSSSSAPPVVATAAATTPAVASSSAMHLIVPLSPVVGVPSTSASTSSVYTPSVASSWSATDERELLLAAKQHRLDVANWPTNVLQPFLHNGSRTAAEVKQQLNSLLMKLKSVTASASGK